MSIEGLSAEEIREAQVAQLDSVMGLYEFNAVLGGFPPSVSVVNPNSLKNAIANQEIAADQTPIGQLQNVLESICDGPKQNTELASTFDKESNPLPDPYTQTNLNLTTDMKFT